MSWVSQNRQEAGCGLIFIYAIARVSPGLGVSWLSCLLSRSLNYSWVSNAMLTVTGCAEKTKKSFPTHSQENCPGVRV